jgi:putative membrane protein
MWHHGDWNAWDWTGMGMMMLLLWGGLVALGVWLARGGTSTQERPQQFPGAEALLAQRFARGEIDKDEYILRRDLLQHPAKTP